MAAPFATGVIARCVCVCDSSHARRAVSVSGCRLHLHSGLLSSTTCNLTPAGMQSNHHHIQTFSCISITCMHTGPATTPSPGINRYLELFPGASPVEVAQKLYASALQRAVKDDGEGRATFGPMAAPAIGAPPVSVVRIASWQAPQRSSSDSQPPQDAAATNNSAAAALSSPPPPPPASPPPAPPPPPPPPAQQQTNGSSRKSGVGQDAKRPPGSLSRSTDLDDVTAAAAAAFGPYQLDISSTPNRLLHSRLDAQAIIVPGVVRIPAMQAAVATEEADGGSNGMPQQPPARPTNRRRLSTSSSVEGTAEAAPDVSNDGRVDASDGARSSKPPPLDVPPHRHKTSPRPAEQQQQQQPQPLLPPPALITIRLSRRPSSDVRVSIAVPATWDGSPAADVSPRVLLFCPGNALEPQVLQVQHSAIGVGPHFLELRFASDDSSFDGALHTIRVEDERPRAGEDAQHPRRILAAAAGNPQQLRAWPAAPAVSPAGSATAQRSLSQQPAAAAGAAAAAPPPSALLLRQSTATLHFRDAGTTKGFKHNYSLWPRDPQVKP